MVTDGTDYSIVGASYDHLEKDVGILFDRFQEANRHAKLQNEERERTLNNSLTKLADRLIH